MSRTYKPEGYSSVSPYLVVKEAQKTIELLKQIFNAVELRKYHSPDGKIVHCEVKLDDSVIMLADSNEHYPPNHQLIHVYLSDVQSVFDTAIKAGCESIQPPSRRKDDPDLRGAFKDFDGNIWSVSTQM